MQLPPADKRYDQNNENQARHLLEAAFNDLETRLAALEALGVVVPPDPTPNVGPTAGFSYAIDNLTVHFTDASTDSDGTIVARAWDFGDGNNSTGTNPTNIYENAGLFNVTLTVTDDAGAQDSVVQAVQLSSAEGGLRVGLWNWTVTEMGTGPGGDTGSPIYKVGLDFGCQPNEVNQAIALCDQHDISFILCPSRGRNGYTDANGFSRSLYEQKVRAYEGNPTLLDAIKRRRVFLMLGDEFNHPSFDVAGVGTCDPADVNWMGNLHKQIFKSGGVVPLTFVRMGAATLRDGWNGFGTRSSTYWTGLDYGWEQRSGQHNSETLSSYYTTNKDDLLLANLGMVPGLNWWNGGLYNADLDGIAMCWDMENNGVSDGVIAGDNADGTPYEAFEHINCPPNAGLNRTIASPAWIKKWADVVSADPDAPFAILWTNTSNGGGGVVPNNAVATALQNRSDYVSAMNYAINTGAARSVFNGLRTAKPGVAV